MRLGTVATGGVAFLHDAQADFAQFAAIVGLAPFCAAPHTVDPLGLEFYLVHLSPLLCHFLTQTMVIVQGGDACLAFLAVKAATGNQLFHFFAYYFSCYTFTDSSTKVRIY